MASRETGTGSNVRWTPEQKHFLLDNAGLDGKEIVAAFRGRWKKFSGSDTSIRGRRYAMLHRSKSPAQRMAAIEARLVGARERVEVLEAELMEVQAEVWDAIPHEEEALDYNSLSRAELMALADERDITYAKRATKTALISQLVAA